jgi:nucleoid DNA-binding protein
MATITKKELITKITETLNIKRIPLSQNDVSEVVHTLIDEITQFLGQGDDVVMRNFGTFHVREMKAKVGRNPKNPGVEVKIPSRAGIKFKPGKEMKETIANTLEILKSRKD